MRGDFDVSDVDGSPAIHARRTALQHCGPLSGPGMKNAFVVVIYDDLSDRRRHEGNRTDPVV
jgi:hypothetical protein